MRKKNYVVIFLLLLYSNIFAATTGKLTGKVVDESDNPLIYANIILEDLAMGAQSDKNGRFILSNIEAGKYNIICSKMGFKTHKIVGVIIDIDETTTQNFNLQRSALEVAGITVSEARNKLVDKLKTSSGISITQQVIEDVNVTEIEDLVALQAGAFINNGELHIRGGRMNEVAYIIDGISVSDIVDGEAALAVDIDSIEEMKVMTGGFPAEYGNAQSGIINIVTKKGGGKYSGKFEFSSDKYKDKSNNEIVRFSFSGPIIPKKNLREKLTFFFNGKIDRADTYLKENYGANPWEEIYLYGVPVLNSFWRFREYYNPYDNREEFWGVELDERNNNKYNLNGKLYYAISPTEKIIISARTDEVHYFPFDHQWRYAMEHFKEIKIIQNQGIITYSKAIGSKINIDTKLGYYNKTYKENPRDFDLNILFEKDPDNFDLYATNNLGNCSGIIYKGEDGMLSDIDELWNFDICNNYVDLNNYFKSPDSYYEKFVENSNDVITVKADLDYQLNNVHGFRTGIEFIKHNVKRYKLVNPYMLNSYRYYEYLANHGTPLDSTYVSFFDKWEYIYGLDDIYNATLQAAGDTFGFKAQPVQFSYYLQDKMEWEGLVVNAGLRLDSWYLGKSYKQLNDENIYDEIVFEKDKRLHVMLSPRLGVSHAISEKSVLHFAFNYQNQIPQLSTIYTDATIFDIFTGSQSYESVILGNPEMEPQVTITGEIGLQRQFFTKYFADISVYYKRSYNYPGMEKTFEDPTDPMVYWYRYIAEDYGTAKGVDVNFQKTLSNFFTASLGYSLSWAEGTNSNQFEIGLDEMGIVENNSLREFPLDWDSRHNVGVNITFMVKDKEELYIPFSSNKIPIDDFSVNFTYNYASGTPYTDVLSDEVNGRIKPHTENANLNISKSFNLLGSSKLKLFVKIKNMFDYKNINFAYISTGSPYYDGTECDNLEEQQLHNMNRKNPQNINPSREIILGGSISF